MTIHQVVWVGIVTLYGSVFLTNCVWADKNAALKAEGTVPLAMQPHPEVSCDEKTCEVRVAVTIDGQTLRSRPLPFHALSSELADIPIDASFGLGQSLGRVLSAWAIGKEEQSIGVALEPIAIGAKYGIIAHQTAGYDHPKRAHVVMEIVEDGLKIHMEVVEESGPDYIELWPATAGVVLSRRQGDSEKAHIEHYRWQVSGKTRSLVLVE